MTGLVEGFWDDLFPLPDEDGIATRVGPVAGLNGASGEGTLSQPLRKLPLFLRPDGAPMQFWQFEQSSDLAAIVDPERRQQRIDAGTVPFDTVENEARAAGTAHFAVLRDQADAAGEAWRALADALDGRAGADAPPTSRVRELLEKISNAVAAASPRAEAAAPAEATALLLPAVVALRPSSGFRIAAPPGAVASREEALRSLAAIADFFRRTEPLSPLSYTLAGSGAPRADELAGTARRDRARMPTLRGQILTSLGIRPPPTE